MSEPAQPQQQQPTFVIEKLYVKDLSLEIPNAPKVFLEREAPEINMQLGGKNQSLGDGLYEVLLTVTVTAKIKDKVLFLVEAQQAGVFRIDNISEDEIGPVLGIGCPNIIFRICAKWCRISLYVLAFHQSFLIQLILRLFIVKRDQILS